MLDRFFNPNPTIHKWDRFWLGFFPGLILPLLAIPFFYAIKFTNVPFMDYVHSVEKPAILSPILSFGAIANLFFFFPLTSNGYYNAGRGVIAATILYGVPIVITKFM